MKDGLFYNVLDANLFKMINGLFWMRVAFLYCCSRMLWNPLGSQRVKHKTVMFYYTFVNIHLHLRSKLSSNKLLCCVLDKLLKKSGFSQLSEELNELDEGVEFLLDGEMKMFLKTIVKNWTFQFNNSSATNKRSKCFHSWWI